MAELPFEFIASEDPSTIYRVDFVRTPTMGERAAYARVFSDILLPGAKGVNVVWSWGDGVTKVKLEGSIPDLQARLPKAFLAVHELVPVVRVGPLA